VAFIFSSPLLSSLITVITVVLVPSSFRPTRRRLRRGGRGLCGMGCTPFSFFPCSCFCSKEVFGQVLAPASGAAVFSFLGVPLCPLLHSAPFFAPPHGRPWLDVALFYPPPFNLLLSRHSGDALLLPLLNIFAVLSSRTSTSCRLPSHPPYASPVVNLRIYFNRHLGAEPSPYHSPGLRNDPCFFSPPFLLRRFFVFFFYISLPPSLFPPH